MADGFLGFRLFAFGGRGGAAFHLLFTFNGQHAVTDFDLDFIGVHTGHFHVDGVGLVVAVDVQAGTDVGLRLGHQAGRPAGREETIEQTVDIVMQAVQGLEALFGLLGVAGREPMLGIYTDKAHFNAS